MNGSGNADSPSRTDVREGFLCHRKLRFYDIKNALRGSHCGEAEDVAGATRRRRRSLPSRLFYSIGELK
ncbi:hypothetical protein B5F37_10940 [Drancourtella sp. An210]|nr:hypothetical protein B5F37_10940 [Drancourtella sp. An210]OUP63027.1 hypothetical protein B5F13_11775 [Drancourtella sp. An177]